jgi:hypothetical protein
MHYKLKIFLGYFVSSLFLGIFSFVYLSFVPGVFNIWMVGVFSIPLLGSSLELWRRKNNQASLGWTCYRLGLTTFVVQLVLKGVYEIALTGFRGELYFFFTATFLLVLGLYIQFKE